MLDPAVPISRPPLPPELAEPDDAFPAVYVAELDPDDLPAEVGRWRISGTATAEWAMRHVAHSEAELAKLRAQADDWQNRISHWFEQAAREHLNRRQFFTGRLEEWAIGERDASGGEVKSQRLPSGKISTREAHARLAVRDGSVIIGWAQRTEGVDLDAVAPHGPRKVSLTGLKAVAHPVEVVAEATLTLSDGEIVDWRRDDVPFDRPELEGCPQVGDGWPTPDTATALVARVEVRRTYWNAEGPDGGPVPGVDVEGPTLTASVTVEEGPLWPPR